MSTDTSDLKWITNKPRHEVEETKRALHLIGPGRILIEGPPLGSSTYSVQQLVDLGEVGIYEKSPSEEVVVPYDAEAVADQIEHMTDREVESAIQVMRRFRQILRKFGM